MLSSFRPLLGAMLEDAQARTQICLTFVSTDHPVEYRSINTSEDLIERSLALRIVLDSKQEAGPPLPSPPALTDCSRLLPHRSILTNNRRAVCSNCCFQPSLEPARCASSSPVLYLSTGLNPGLCCTSPQRLADHRLSPT